MKQEIMTKICCMKRNFNKNLKDFLLILDNISLSGLVCK